LELRQLGISRMILTTHAVVGAAIASFVPSHPATALPWASLVISFWTRFRMSIIR
jgi:hypothetical protein